MYNLMKGCGYQNKIKKNVKKMLRFYHYFLTEKQNSGLIQFLARQICNLALIMEFTCFKFSS